MKALELYVRLTTWGGSSSPSSCAGHWDIDVKDPLEIYVEGDTILLRKHDPPASSAGQPGYPQLRGKNICADCLKTAGADLKNP
jgi:transcriptional pleiotropic regulator of transition state genes